MRHLMSPLDFSVEELDHLMDLAADIEANPEKYAHACAGKKLATLFYEPSTCLLYTSGSGGSGNRKGVIVIFFHQPLHDGPLACPGKTGYYRQYSFIAHANPSAFYSIFWICSRTFSISVFRSMPTLETSKSLALERMVLASRFISWAMKDVYQRQANFWLHT